MPTTNSATLLNEVTFYQSQQHLLCFEKLHHKHGEAYYLPSIMPMLGHRGFGPQHGNHRTRILSRSLSQNSPTISLSFHHSSGDWFSLPCSYLECDTVLYPLNTGIPSHKGTLTLPGGPFPFWVSTKIHSHGNGTPVGSLTSPLPKQSWPPLPQRVVVKAKWGHKRKHTLHRNKGINRDTQ